MKGMEKKCDDSVLIEHIREAHEGKMTEPPCHSFKMNVTSSHYTALDRLVTEAVKIETCHGEMNRKQGFRSNNVLKLETSIRNNTP